MKTIQCLRCNTTTTINNIQPGDVITCQACGCIIAHIPEHSDYHPDSPCPYCGSELTDDDITVFCPECQMEYHLDCWNEGEGCATYGCKMTGVLRPVPTKITWEDLQSDINNFSQNKIGTGIPMPTGHNVINVSRTPVHKVEGPYFCNNCNRMVARSFCPYCNNPTQKINSHLLFAIFVAAVCFITPVCMTDILYMYMPKSINDIMAFFLFFLFLGILSIIISTVSKVCKFFKVYNLSKKLGNISLILSSIILLLVFIVIFAVLLQCNLN